MSLSLSPSLSPPPPSPLTPASASMTRMENSADRDRQSSPRGGKSIPTVFTNAEKRGLRLFLGLMALGVYWLIWHYHQRGEWGLLSMRTQLGGLVFPVFAALLWLPIVWATLRWWLRDMLRAAKGPSRGKHAKEPAPGLALFSLAIVVGILAAVVYPSWQQRVALAQDWWQGPVRHDNVRCVVKGDLSSLSTLKSQSWKFAEFDLVGEDGYSQHFMLKFADLDRETDRIDSPFNTVADVCELPWTTMTVRVYPRTGIIDEASVSK